MAKRRSAAQAKPAGPKRPFDATEFAVVYEQALPKAIRVLVGRGFPRAVAEDAVQEAATWLLQHNRQAVTASVLVQYAVRHAINVSEAAYGSDRPKGKARLVIHSGSSIDLAAFEEGPACTGEEGE